MENKDEVLRQLRGELARPARSIWRLRGLSKKRYEGARKLEKLVELTSTIWP